MKYLITILFLLILGILAYSESTPELNYAVFRIMHLMVLAYVVWRSWLYFKRNPNFWLINPLFTTLIITFGLNFGLITNFLFLQKNSFLVADYNLDLNHNMYWYKVAMFHIGVAAVALFLGHESKWGITVYKIIRNLISKLLATISMPWNNLYISKSKVLFVYILITLFKVWQFKNGVYGRLIAEELLESEFYQRTSQYINLLNSAGLGAFFFISFLFHQQKISRFLFYLLLSLELLWGFLAGSRGSFLFPIAIVLFSGYLTSNRLKKSSIIYFTLALFVSMVIILPFKNFYQSYRGGLEIRDVNLLLSKFYTYYSTQQNYSENSSSSNLDSWYFTLFSHTNYSTEVAASIRHKDLFGLNSAAPAFLEDIFLAPIFSIVPRFLWQGKSTSIHGLWFRENILQYNVGLGTYSIAMTPIGYLYFAGGTFAVFLGFWVVGVLQKSFFLFLHSFGLAGLIIFLIMMAKFHFVDSAFHAIIINYIRDIFISVIAILLFCRVKL